MRKLALFTAFILLIAALGGCSDGKDAASSTSPAPSSQQSGSMTKALPAITVGNETTPKSDDEADKYEDTLLSDLNDKLGGRSVGDIYFIDNNTILFSVYNSKSTDKTEKYDLYKYGLKEKALTLLCKGFTLSYNDFIKVTDTNNFSIIGNGVYLKITDNAAKTKRNFLDEAKADYPYACSAVYNENNGKLLILENDSDMNINDAYITNTDFTSPTKLAFKNVSSVCWADANTALIAYKDADASVYIAQYSLSKKSTVVTKLPDKSYFIDPVMSDGGMIRSMYLQSITDLGTPWGFLNVNTGVYDRVYFKSCNPFSMVRSGRMAAFTRDMTSADTYLTATELYLYDNSTKTKTVRSKNISSPSGIAVSPDGKTIVYTTYQTDAGIRFYINQK